MKTKVKKVRHEEGGHDFFVGNGDNKVYVGFITAAGEIFLDTKGEQVNVNQHDLRELFNAMAGDSTIKK